MEVRILSSNLFQVIMKIHVSRQKKWICFSNLLVLFVILKHLVMGQVGFCFYSNPALFLAIGWLAIFQHTSFASVGTTIPPTHCLILKLHQLLPQRCSSPTLTRTAPHPIPSKSFQASCSPSEASAETFCHSQTSLLPAPRYCSQLYHQTCPM